MIAFDFVSIEGTVHDGKIDSSIPLAEAKFVNEDSCGLGRVKFAEKLPQYDSNV
jgi:hypothetical protein